MLRVITHGAVFILGAVLAKSVRPLLSRAATALRPVAKDALREGILATRAVRQLAAEAGAEIDAETGARGPRAIDDARPVLRLSGDV